MMETCHNPSCSKYRATLTNRCGAYIAALSLNCKIFKSAKDCIFEAAQAEVKALKEQLAVSDKAMTRIVDVFCGYCQSMSGSCPIYDDDYCSGEKLIAHCKQQAAESIKKEGDK